jgi:hypothetical protein
MFEGAEVNFRGHWVYYFFSFRSVGIDRSNDSHLLGIYIMYWVCSNVLEEHIASISRVTEFGSVGF